MLLSSLFLSQLVPPLPGPVLQSTACQPATSAPRISSSRSALERSSEAARSRCFNQVDRRL